MDAIILTSNDREATADLVRPVAGAPLLVRQLEWLGANGIHRVAINRVADEPLPPELYAEQLARTGVEPVWIPTAEPLDPRALARRLGTGAQPCVIVPHAVLGNSPLGDAIALATESGQDVVVEGADAGVAIRHLSRQATGEEYRIASEEWLLCVSGEGPSHQLTEELLSRQRVGVEIRGTEVSPGVWRARGATIVEGAKLRAPCYLGAGCFVAADAIVGPGAVLGEDAVVEAGARILHARVEREVIVGQGVAVEHACAKDGAIVRHGGRAVPIADSLLVERQPRGATAPRLAAALAVSAIAPVAAVVGGPVQPWLRRLGRVVAGDGAWVGTRDPDDADAVVLDVLPLLLPSDAREEDRRAAQAWYHRAKTRRLDVRLVASLLLDGIRAGGNHA